MDYPRLTSLWATPASAPIADPTDLMVPLGQRSFGTARGGPRLGLSFTAFSATHLAKTDPARLNKMFAFVRDIDPDWYPRIFGYVPNSGKWALRYLPSAEVPRYLEAAIKTAATHGFRSCPVVLGDSYGTSDAERMTMVQQSLLNMVGHEGYVVHWAIANEGHGGTLEDMYRYGQWAKAHCPNFISLTSTEDIGGPDVVHGQPNDPSTMFEAHPERNDGNGNEPCRYTRSPYGYNEWRSLQGKRGHFSESRGPASSIIQTTDPYLINADALMTWLEGWNIYNYHPGGQVYQIDWPDYENGHRYANLYDDPYSAALMKNLSTLRNALPQDLCEWGRRGHGNPSNNGTFPFTTESGQQWDKAFTEYGTRVYSAWQANNFMMVVLCQKANIECKAPHNMQFRVRSVLDYHVMNEVTLGAGSSYVLPATQSCQILEGTWQ